MTFQTPTHPFAPRATRTKSAKVHYSVYDTSRRPSAVVFIQIRVHASAMRGSLISELCEKWDFVAAGENDQEKKFIQTPLWGTTLWCAFLTSAPALCSVLFSSLDSASNHFTSCPAKRKILSKHVIERARAGQENVWALHLFLPRWPHFKSGWLLLFCSCMPDRTAGNSLEFLSVNEWSVVNGLSAIYMLPERYIASGALIVLNGIFPFPESIRHLNFIWMEPLNIQSHGALSDPSNKISL